MPRFFGDQNNISDNTILIVGEDARHIGRSLRMKIGEELTVTCEMEDYKTKIISITDENVICEILSKEKCETEANIKLTLYQAIPKSDKLELICQKAVELGVYKIVPVITRRCVSKPDAKSFKKKKERLEKIILSAAKQSGRGIIPEITDIINFNEVKKDLLLNDKAYICYEKWGESFLKQDFSECVKSIGLFIGSEGGFDEQEAFECKESGIIPINLGKRILRCETAPISAISIIMALSNNM